MALKRPLLCGSIYVAGSCTIRMGGSVDGLFTVTVPEGRYWCDPLMFPYPPLVAPNGSFPEAFSFLSYLIDLVTTATVCSYTAIPSPGDAQQTGYVCFITDMSQTLTIYPGDSNTSNEGRRFLSFLGFHGRHNFVASGGTIQANGYAAAWRPSRYEVGDIDEKRAGFTAVVEMAGGTVATTNLGADLRGRVVAFEGLPGSGVKQRGPVASLLHCPFESVLHPWTGRGDLVRYYEDLGATVTTTVTDAPLSATASVMTVPASAGLTNTVLCVDGEWIATGTAPSGTTLNISRDARTAEAHPYGSPISSSYVGAYALAKAGGNVNARGFDPVRRTGQETNQDRWNMEIALTRAVWN